MNIDFVEDIDDSDTLSEDISQEGSPNIKDL